MATPSYIAEAASTTKALPLPSKLHEWIVTVDHKRLGILYIATALFFFAVAGVLPNSAENLRAWVKDPQAIKHGNLMPNMQLNPRELDEVVTYLASLK